MARMNNYSIRVLRMANDQNLRGPRKFSVAAEDERRETKDERKRSSDSNTSGSLTSIVAPHVGCLCERDGQLGDHQLVQADPFLYGFAL